MFFSAYLSLCLFLSNALAQDVTVKNVIKYVDLSSIALKGKRTIQASKYRLVEIDVNQLYAALENAPHRDGLKAGEPVQIELPFPNGTMKLYQVKENNTLHPELGAKFPEIRTYDAYGVDNPSELVKFDITPKGFHAMILSPGKSPVFIDPLLKDETTYYMVYNKKNFITSKFINCGVLSQGQSGQPLYQFKHFADFNTCELRTYRLAMAATAQYTQYQGGTVPQALAAQVTTMNRVNGIYETDMAVTMQIIPNNNLIIYTDPNNQPYTSGQPQLEITQNQTNIDAVIGSANYDIGHVVDAAGSGLAALRSVCVVSEKAEGVTGTANPNGDPFDIDYVAHEMGHQFGANHTQNNNCNRNDPTAVEPGSGSTIMGYAGICSPNVQRFSNAYFHGISLQEMGTFISNPNHNCAVKTPIPAAPLINTTNGFHIIPANTPFALTASATQNGGTSELTYTWEQMNNEISQQPPVSSATGGPNFRSFLPAISATRFFPNLTALANHGPFTWEVLSSVSRVFKFRLSVRRNTSGGSCNSYTDVTLTTDNRAGPFIVTNPAVSGIGWMGNSLRTVHWDVANTNVPPVNAQFVDILLSTDGGVTYPYTVVTGIPNNGSKEVCVPNRNTNSARIMVRAANGTFFNVSHNNLSIIGVPPGPPELTEAVRDPMKTTKAFIYIAGCISSSNNVYTVNGLNAATIKLDSNNNRFIIANINTPKKVSISITMTGPDHVGRISNQILIPSIL
jgi:predicted Zn-dependent protease